MSERSKSDSVRNQVRYRTNPAKMSDGDLGTRKTLFVLVIVAGCFAVLWPKVFYPMLAGTNHQRIKPNDLDKGCCDVISDIDINTIKIMSELCNSIVQQTHEKPLKGQEIIAKCREKVLSKCHIDISAVLQEQVRLGRTFKQIVDEVRSFNGSLCLKYNFGVSPWRLGISHRIMINLTPAYIRQERPSHLRPEMLHPALREKGRAIAQPYQYSGKSSHPKFVDGRPGPVPGIRPPMGGAGHVVHPPQKGINSMGVIMPIYTIGIVIFFSYTLMKLLFKKKPEGASGGLYPPIESSAAFRKEVFESHTNRVLRSPSTIVNAMTALLDEVDQELEARRRANEVANQKEEPTSNGTILANGKAKQTQEFDQPSVKVLGMEMTASCEGGEKWSRPESPVLPSSPSLSIPTEPPQEIYLKGALPAQSRLLVADSTTETETNFNNSSPDPAVVLASKMTLSVISLDAQEDEIETQLFKRSHLQNDTAVDIEQGMIDDESKYTTASGTTTAEREILEEDLTEGEDEIEEEMECTQESFAQKRKDIDGLKNDIEVNDNPNIFTDNSKGEKYLEDELVEKEGSPENTELQETLMLINKEDGVNLLSSETDIIDNTVNVNIKTSVLSSETINNEDNDVNKIKSENSAIIFHEENYKRDEDDDQKYIYKGMTVEEINSVADVIDDVINTGARVSELISAERDADSDNEKKKNDDIDTTWDIIKSEAKSKSSDDEDSNENLMDI